MEQLVQHASEAVSAAPYPHSRDPDARPGTLQPGAGWDASRTPFYTEGGSPVFFQREVISGCPAWVGVILLALLVVLSLLAC
jgi:hypothetical protein